MPSHGAKGMVQCGRQFTGQEIEQICETVRMCGGLAVSELAETICEHLGWYTAGGAPKRDACRKLLGKLEAQGWVRLPEKRAIRKAKQSVRITERSAARPAIRGSVQQVCGLRLERVGRAEVELFKEYLQRYHPLGYRKPFGYWMRYFIESDRGTLGCLLFGGAAKSLGLRDRWIGWTESQRLQRLAWVVGLSRHLIFPWVELRNLSSSVLGLVGRQIPRDWDSRWGYRPVLLETFVDPRKYLGSSYKAAGWTELGMTSGEGLVRPGESYLTTPKRIFVKPLCADFRTLLCSELPPARRLQ